MHQCVKFILFWNDTLHVSDGLSVHHHVFKTVYTATGICQADTAVYFILFWNDTLRVSDGLSVHHQVFKTVHTATGSICLTNACCCMYSLEHLMMDGKTVRNM